MNGENEEIVPITNEVVTFRRDVGELTFHSDKDVDEFIARVERRNTAIERITKAAISKLLPKDFVDMDGKPFLQGVGAERLKKYFGIQVLDVERIPVSGYEVVEEDEAARLRVTYRAKYRLGDMEEVGVGLRDTHNKFLCKKAGEYKPISEINLPDLDQSARTAMDRDGISRLLGLRGLTWEYLGELGFSPDKTTSVTYAKGTDGGNVSVGNDEVTAQQQKVREMILEMSGGDGDMAKKMLKDYTRSAKDPEKYPGYADVKKITPKQMEWLFPKIEKDYGEFMVKMHDEQTGEPELPLK